MGWICSSWMTRVTAGFPKGHGGQVTGAVGSGQPGLLWERGSPFSQRRGQAKRGFSASQLGEVKRGPGSCQQTSRVAYSPVPA